MKRNQQKLLNTQRTQRVQRVRAQMSGTAHRPRLAVHRSLRFFSAQIIDDAKGATIVAVHQRELGKNKLKPVEAAAAMGKMIAERAVAAGVKSVVFDRRHYRYHGRVQAFADAARESGLNF